MELERWSIISKSKTKIIFKNTEIGKFPSDWRIQPLSNLIKKVFTGRDPKGGKLTESKVTTGIKIIKSANVYDGFLDFRKAGEISHDVAKTITSAEIFENDVLLNQLGDGVTFARSCIVSKDALPAYVTRSVGVIRVDSEKMIPGFLNAYLVLPQTKLYIESL